MMKLLIFAITAVCGALAQIEIMRNVPLTMTYPEAKISNNRVVNKDVVAVAKPYPLIWTTAINVTSDACFNDIGGTFCFLDVDNQMVFADVQCMNNTICPNVRDIRTISGTIPINYVLVKQDDSQEYDLEMRRSYLNDSPTINLVTDDLEYKVDVLSIYNTDKTPLQPSIGTFMLGEDELAYWAEFFSEISLRYVDYPSISPTAIPSPSPSTSIVSASSSPQPSNSNGNNILIKQITIAVAIVLTIIVSAFVAIRKAPYKYISSGRSRVIVCTKNNSAQSITVPLKTGGINNQQTNPNIQMSGVAV